MKAVVLQPLGLGDVVLSLSMVQAFKKGLPETHVSMVVRESMAEIPGLHPDVDAVLHFAGSGSGVFRYASLVSKLSAGNFDVAVVCPGSIIAAAAPAGARIPQRIGSDQTLGLSLFKKKIRYRRLQYQTEGSFAAELLDRASHALHRPSIGSFFYTDTIALDPEQHATERLCSLLWPLGITGAAQPPVIPPGGSGIDGIGPVGKDAGIGWDALPIAVVPGSVWATKQWGGDRYLSLIVQLLKRYEEKNILLCGSVGETELCDSLDASAGNSRVKDLSGRVTVGQLAEIFRRCAVVVCNDSGAGHLAAAVGTPTVSIFGPTVPEFGFAPRGNKSAIVEGDPLPCRPCGPYGGTYCPVRTHECMISIQVSSVMKAVENLIG